MKCKNDSENQVHNISKIDSSNNVSLYIDFIKVELFSNLVVTSKLCLQLSDFDAIDNWRYMMFAMVTLRATVEEESDIVINKFNNKNGAVKSG